MIKNEGNVKNFWNGFLAGGVVAGAVLYVFGTKNVRKGLATLIRFSEDLEANVGTILHHASKTSDKKSSKKQGSLLETISTVLDRIQVVAKNT